MQAVQKLKSDENKSKSCIVFSDSVTFALA